MESWNIFGTKKFLRGTKNAFISIVPESLIADITKRQPVTYAALVKRLQKRKIPSRVSELRDYYGTFMIKHGLVAQEADLLCGRIPPSIFVRHYFSPAIKELRSYVERFEGNELMITDLIHARIKK